MDKKELKEYLDKGYFHINVLFEIVGKPQDYVEKALQFVMKNIKEQSKIKFIKEEYGDAEKTPDDLWATYCEAEMLVPDIDSMAWMAFNFAPASIEVKEPGSITLKDKQITDLMNDILAQIHENNMNSVELKSENTALQKNINAIIRNAILLSISTKEKNANDIGKVLGLLGKDIEPVLEAMINEGKLTSDGKLYKRI